ncbi:MAG: TonB-dependent receptor, partial [Alphaproteobacteria bacterium]|nr:TonB-dependent receptor [Alphaproteobacteria bacterium]
NFFPVFAAGSSKLSGVEFDGTIVPVDGWTIQAAMTYNKNRFTRFNAVTGADIATLGAPPNTNVSLAGNRASRFPKWSGNIASTYTAELTSDYEWFVRGDVIYNGRHVTGTTNLATVKPWTRINARIGVQDDTARFEFFVTNLFDTKRWVAGQDFTDFTIRFPPFDFSKSGVILIPQDKRQFGVRTSIDF